MRIAILCHWHTGSTLLAKTLRMCGMEVGNANTDWYPNCDPPCEHGRLNGLGDAYILGSITEEELREGITQILASYLGEGSLKGWEHYGAKITHAVQKETWDIFKEMFDRLWEPLTYVTILRHPLGVVKSTEGDTKWSAKRVIDSYASSFRALAAIREKGVCFVYPTDWYGDRLKKKVEEVGLTWNEKAKDLFDKNRQRSFTEYELAKFVEEEKNERY